RAFSRRDGIRARDGGGTLARADGRATAATAVRAFAITILAGGCCPAGAGAAALAVVALSTDRGGQHEAYSSSGLLIHGTRDGTSVGGRLSNTADPHSLALFSRRNFRHCRAHCRRQADRSLGAASDRREPARRQWLHRGDRCGTGNAGRLYIGYGDRR